MPELAPLIQVYYRASHVRIVMVCLIGSAVSVTCIWPRTFLLSFPTLDNTPHVKIVPSTKPMCRHTSNATRSGPARCTQDAACLDAHTALRTCDTCDPLRQLTQCSGNSCALEYSASMPKVVTWANRTVPTTPNLQRRRVTDKNHASFTEDRNLGLDCACLSMQLRMRDS